jgi:hypothetical protein
MTAPDEKRLDDLQEHIDHARHTAEQAHVVEDPDQPRFYETGELSDIDDQTIAPPG